MITCAHPGKMNTAKNSRVCWIRERPPHTCKHPSPRRPRGTGSTKYQGRCFQSWKSGPYRDSTDTGEIWYPEQVCVLCPVWSQGLGRWQEEGADCCTVRGWGWQRAHSALAPHHSLGHEPAVYGLQVRVPTSPSLLDQGQKSPKKKSHTTYCKREKSLFRFDHLSHREM